MKKNLCIIVLNSLLYWGVNAQTLTNEFNQAGIFHKPIYQTTHHYLDTMARFNQTQSGYKADKWESTYIHQGDTVVQGKGGLSCYYSVCPALRLVAYDSIKYWQSLQVKRHPIYGFRKVVTLYIVKKDSIPVAVGKASANKNDPTGKLLGIGGAWQFFIEKSQKQNLSEVRDENLK